MANSLPKIPFISACDDPEHEPEELNGLVSDEVEVEKRFRSDRLGWFIEKVPNLCSSTVAEYETELRYKYPLTLSIEIVMLSIKPYHNVSTFIETINVDMISR
jgi:hypothetical protein